VTGGNLRQHDPGAIGIPDPHPGQPPGLGRGPAQHPNAGRGQPLVPGVNIPYLQPDHHRTAPYDFPEAGIQVEMRRFRCSTQEWVSAVLAAPLILRGLYEPLPAMVPDSFARRSKYGLNDPRNVFTREHLERVPGSLILVAERVS
jgi:hypothetical protein